ncbi:MAG: OOP family OmpA-OmpF porin [Flavobacteriales bacterium]|jgi:OOP family OmpA-OmpF porin
MKKTLLALSIAALGSSAAMADDHPTIEAFLGIDITNWTGSREVEDEKGIDLGVGYNINENWALEGWFARSTSEMTRDGSDASVNTFSVNGLRYLAEGKTRPFVTIGASRMKFDSDNFGSVNETSLDLGAGIKHYFDNNIVLRGDLIGRLSEDRFDDFVIEPALRFSVGYAFGQSSTRRTPVATPSKPAPAPAAPVVAAPVDSDGDGVVDVNDQCPGTAEQFKVDANGCELMLSETVKIDLNIQFPNNSDEVTDAYISEINEVAAFMRQYTGTVVEVRGYTDDRGKDTYNQQLSEKRAKAVAAKLINVSGIEADRVSAVGFGEENPIADNNTAEGRASNRRVVAEVSTRVEKTIIK